MLAKMLLLGGGIAATAGVSFSNFLPPKLSPKPPAPEAPKTIIAPAVPVVATTAPSVAKAAVTLDYSKPYTSLHSGPAVVKKETFGTVYTTFNSLPNYKKAVEQVPNSSIRWPGGSFAERTGPDRLYDLTFPDIYKEPAPGDTGYNLENQKGLTDVMAYAVEKNYRLSWLYQLNLISIMLQKARLMYVNL